MVKLAPTRSKEQLDLYIGHNTKKKERKKKTQGPAETFLPEEVEAGGRRRQGAPEPRSAS